MRLIACVGCYITTSTACFNYDEYDNLIQITDALGHVIKLENYNELCNPQTIIDENGVATNLVYNDDVVWYL